MAVADARGVALVTGGGQRIGRTLALTAARAGYDVAVHHRRSPDAANAVVREIEALDRRAVAVAADLADPAALESLIASAGALGPVTLRVNCASLFLEDKVGGIDPAQYDAHQAVNLRAPVLLAQAMARALPAGRDALVVNIIDQRVLNPDPRFFSYALSKAGLHWATRTLAQALAPHVRVNGIGPGPTLRSIHQTEQDFDQEARASLLGRPVPVEQIGAALAYLIDATCVTGQMIAVDSGQHLAWNPHP
jgi:NAD(P)-dependent dehydrogenase (short-subunit alcohol dehydrogenase family)